MSYIKEIFQRTDPQQVAEFLASGDMRRGEETRSYEARMREVEARLSDFLEGAGLADREDEIFACLADYSGIYMELGVRAGAMLATRLLL